MANIWVNTIEDCSLQSLKMYLTVKSKTNNTDGFFSTHVNIIHKITTLYITSHDSFTVFYNWKFVMKWVEGVER